jgi:hypothetical protein
MKSCHDACRAITFLQDFVSEHPAAVDATHVNMLSQLLMEAERYAEALVTLDRAPPAGTGGAYPDIATKQGICLVHLGRVDDGAAALRQLLCEPAPAFHDLFIAVRFALAAT